MAVMYMLTSVEWIDYYRRNKMSEHDAGQKYKYTIKIHMAHQPDLCLELYADASYERLSDIFRSEYMKRRGRYYVFSYQNVRYMIAYSEVAMIELTRRCNFVQEDKVE